MEDFGLKQCFFGAVKKVFLGTALLHDIYCILYTEVILQICRNAQKITNIRYMPVEPKCLVLQRSQCRAPGEAIMERQCSAVQYSMPNTLQLNSGRAPGIEP